MISRFKLNGQARTTRSEVTGRIQRLLGTLSPWRLKGLPPLMQTWNDQSRDRRFHGLARRVELHRFNLPLSWKCLCRWSTGCWCGRRRAINQSFTSASIQEDLKREARRHAFQLASGKDETWEEAFELPVRSGEASCREQRLCRAQWHFISCCPCLSVEFEPGDHGGSVH